MAAPTFVAKYASTLSGSSTPKTVEVTVDDGDILVVGIMGAEPTGQTFSAPSGGTGFTWTKQQDQQTANNGAVAVYTATATQSQTFTMSVARPGATNWGFIVTRWADSDGIGASSKGASNSAPMSLAVTTTEPDSAIVFFASDYNEMSTSGRAWRSINGITPTSGNGLELAAQLVNGWYSVWSAYWPNAGTAGSKTTGMTSPAFPASGMVAIEVLGPSGGASLEAEGDLPLTVTISGSMSQEHAAAGDLPLTVSITGDLSVGGIETAEGDLPLTVAISGDLQITRGPNTITLPAGTVPVRSLSTFDILTGNRHTTLRYDLFTRTEAPKGTLAGVEGGYVDVTAAASVHGGAALTVVDIGQDVDWLNDRIRPVILIDGLPEQPLGMYLASERPEAWGDTGRTWAIRLVDKTSVLDQDEVDETYALDAGAVVTDKIVELIESTGETNHAITPSAATLANPIVWEPGTSKLRIVNDLLKAINYFSLFCDYSGQFRGEPYTRPANRPILWEFLDGEKSIYSPDFVRDVDLYGIPNKVIAVSQGSGDTPALTSTATNEDPLSPYSTASRGRTITHTERGVEITDQTTLDNYARRRLIELTTPTSGVEVQHAFIPGLSFNDAVRVRRVPAGIDHRHVITKMRVMLDPTALVRSTFRQVVDL